MSPESPSPSELARRLELCHAWRSVHYAAAYGRLHSEASPAVLPVGGGFAVYVGPGSPVSGACGLGLDGPVSSADMQTFEDFFLSRQEAPRLHLCPLADESLLARVRERGYRLDGFFSVLALHVAENFTPDPPPPGMTVLRAAPDEAGLWLRVSAQGFEESEEPPSEVYDILGPNFSAEESAPFIAWIDEGGGMRQPAGCGGMYLAPQVKTFELGGASTRVVYRRRGVQRALIDARLAEGARRGCDLAMVLTEPGSNSQGNLQRAGFSLAYTKPVMVK